MKAKSTAALLLSAGLVTACSSDEPEINTIQHADLSDREELINMAHGPSSYIYDVNAGSNYNTMEVWVELYEGQDLVDDEFLHIDTEIDGMSHIKFYRDSELSERADDHHQDELGIVVNGAEEFPAHTKGYFEPPVDEEGSRKGGGQVSATQEHPVSIQDNDEAIIAAKQFRASNTTLGFDILDGETVDTGMFEASDITFVVRAAFAR
ncbi:hypothetical protein B0H94_11146 [Salsuginibacillus halophilus]|uniref:Uncharacterized protein n=1 Tax=Salsuginibacillus halophilus TaxID=517424 RepID=A0A2P8HAG8_9BACI|nr:hypothetical protein [Salsuginibacillus halophilus]PSL43223.1 hypothetical protein B0H94_11146 [Salsuginibacillus halophilus]